MFVSFETCNLKGPFSAGFPAMSTFSKPTCRKHHWWNCFVSVYHLPSGMMWESIQTDSKLTMTKSLQDFGIGLHCSSLGKIEWPVLGLLQNTRPHYPAFPDILLSMWTHAKSFKVMFGNATWCNGLIAHSKRYIFVWSFSIFNRCKCMYIIYGTSIIPFIKKLPFQLQSQQGQCISSFASSELLLLSPHVGPADFGRFMPLHHNSCSRCKYWICKCIYVSIILYMYCIL